MIVHDSYRTMLKLSSTQRLPLLWLLRRQDNSISELIRSQQVLQPRYLDRSTPAALLVRITLRPITGTGTFTAGKVRVRNLLSGALA